MKIVLFIAVLLATTILTGCNLHPTRDPSSSAAPTQAAPTPQPPTATPTPFVIEGRISWAHNPPDSGEFPGYVELKFWCGGKRYTASVDGAGSFRLEIPQSDRCQITEASMDTPGWSFSSATQSWTNEGLWVEIYVDPPKPSTPLGAWPDSSW